MGSGTHAKSGTMDLTQGNILNQILVFAFPLFLGQLFQNLYNSADSLIVGNLLERTSLAAVSSSADIAQCLIGFFTGLSTGGAVLVSRHFGSKDYRGLHDAVHTLISFAVIVGVVMAVSGILLTGFLLQLVNCPDNVMEEATAYLRVYLVGVLFTSIYNVGAGILRAVGDSRRPFIYLVISSIVNVILDLLFIGPMKMGVAGAAWATIIAQFLSVVMVYVRMLRTRDVYRVIPADLLKINPSMLMEIMVLGLPAGIQSAIVSVSNLFVQRYVNDFGDAAMAGIGVAKKIDRFVGTISQCVGLATATFVSQNIGARKIGRAFQGIRVCLVISMVHVLLLGTPIYIFAEDIIGLFSKDNDAETIYYGASLLHVMMPLYYFQGLMQIFMNASRGFGKSIEVMIAGLFGMVGVRQVYLFFFTKLFPDSIIVVDIGFPVGWFFAFLGSFLIYILMVRIRYRDVHAGDESEVELRT